MKYIIILFIAINTYSIDSFYYNFNKKIPLYSSEYYIGIKTEYMFSNDGIKKKLESINGISKIDEVKNVGENLFLLKFSSKIDDVKNILEKTPFVVYEIEGFHIKPSDEKSSWPRFIDKQIVVKFKETVSPERITEILKENNLFIQNTKNIDYSKYLVVKTNENISKILNIANKLQELPEVEFSHPDFITIYKKLYNPDDTYFPKQWHHVNGVGGVDSVGAWDITMGSKSIKIAIIDDGIDATHEDLNVIASKNFSKESANLGAEHGTACSGVAAAIGDNGKGMIGICPNCSLISAKLLSENGAIYQSSKSEAFNWAVIMGADVISNSWGASEAVPISEEFKNTIDNATTNGRNGKGAVVVFAVGNDNRELLSFEISSQRNIIAVGASDYQDKRAEYSNYGDFVDVVAPSSAGTYESFHIPQGNIWTTDRMGALGYNNNGYSSSYYITEVDSAGNYTKYFGGTSSAAPLVSGLAGIILSEAPNLTYQEVINVIKTTADKIGGSNEYDANGYSTNFGYGKVNIKKAVLEAQRLSTCVPNPNGEICDNNIDDDCDSFVDNLDADCNNYNPCSQYVCPSNSECVFYDAFNPEGPNINISCVCDLGYKKDGENCILDPQYNPCENTLCSNHGTCEALTLTEVKCNCDVDYHNEGDTGLICRKDDACTYVECQENAFCSTSDAQCYCSRGYYYQDSECLKYDVGSLCETAMCEENAKCSNDDGECHCNEGYEYDLSGVCVEKTTTDPVIPKTKNDSSCSYSNQNNSINPYFFLLFMIFIVIRKRKLN
jgi:subtilisin family serine protease